MSSTGPIPHPTPSSRGDVREAREALPRWELYRLLAEETRPRLLALASVAAVASACAVTGRRAQRFPSLPLAQRVRTRAVRPRRVRAPDVLANVVTKPSDRG